MELNKQNLIDALGAKLSVNSGANSGANLVEIKGDFSVSSYSIDTRSLQKGDVFVALQGANDGHNYLDTAISKGASCLIISQSFYAQNPINFPNLIIVKDTLQALADIAKFNGEQFSKNSGKLVGITGSVGKTTLKEMLSFILSQNSVVSATLGNFNNHIGLPLSLAQIKETASFGVFEMGMSSVGEIEHLSKILKPQMAVITEIAEAHAEFFASTKTHSSLDLIAQAKAEILEGMEYKSVIFLNKDNQYFDAIKTQAEAKGIVVYSFSLNNVDADIYVASTTFKNYSMQVNAHIFGENITYSIKSMAQHNAMLSALGFGMAKKLGVDTHSAVENFVNFSIPKGRGEISKISFKGHKITLIDDSYNANPKSMHSSILALKNIEANKILVLGDMLELGTSEVLEHIKLKQSINCLSNVKGVVLVGSLMKNLADALKVDSKGLSVVHFSNYEQALEYLEQNIKDDDLVFIKGSFGSEVHKISKYLQN